MNKSFSPDDCVGEMSMTDKMPPEIPMSRRKELMAYAGEVAEQVSDKVQKHELCLFNSMCQMLLDRYR